MEPLITFLIFLNHFYLTVDAETYDAIEASDFLHQQFAPYELRTTQRTDISYTAQYFYGKNTYFEFFKSGGGNPYQGSGLAIGIEEAGGAERLARLWWSEVTTITRGYEGEQVPWFKLTAPANLTEEDAFTMWAMEYVPKFLPNWHPGKSDATGISREALLNRYKAVLEPVDNPVMQDVIGLKIAMKPSALEKFKTYAQQWNYEMVESKEEWQLQGPEGFQLSLFEVKGGEPGIREITFKTNYEPEQRKHRFGNSTLTFKGDQAVWVFK